VWRLGFASRRGHETYLMPSSRIMELYLHSPIRLHGTMHRDNFILRCTSSSMLCSCQLFHGAVNQVTARLVNNGLGGFGRRLSRPARGAISAGPGGTDCRCPCKALASTRPRPVCCSARVRDPVSHPRRLRLVM
jgi:hypothetical protein